MDGIDERGFVTWAPPVVELVDTRTFWHVKYEGKEYEVEMDGQGKVIHIHAADPEQDIYEGTLYQDLVNLVDKYRY
jgi:hypothetical protein